jgi:hypothetical protein
MTWSTFHRAVAEAVRDGVLPPVDARQCIVCAAVAARYHHHTYREGHQLDVAPVCNACHGKIHSGTLLDPTSGEPWCKLCEEAVDCGHPRDALSHPARDAPRLQLMVNAGLSNTAIARQLTEEGRPVTAPTVQRRREDWGMALDGQVMKRRTRQKALLTVELTREQYESAKANAMAAGYRSLSEWVRALILRNPPIVPDRSSS